MARRRQFLNDIFPLHVSARSLNGEWFGLPMIDVWDIFSRQLYFLTLTYGVRIHAFVLMSNHFHLILTDANGNSETAMACLLRNVSQAIQVECGKPHPVFEGPSHATQIKNRLYYEYAYKYVYRNPVEARICSRVENYPYSSLRGLLGLDPLPFPAFDNMNLIANPAQKLSWLNSPYPTADFLEEIRKAMQTSEFELFSEEREARLKKLISSELR